MNLNELTPALGSNKSRKRVGRGLGKHGKTCGRGEKGQKKRNSVPLYFEGGQMPLIQRIPKYGFSSRVGLTTECLPMDILNAIDTSVHKAITLAILVELNLIKRRTKRVKLYNKGELKGKGYHCIGIMVTQSVKKSIEKAGGSVTDAK